MVTQTQQGPDVSNKPEIGDGGQDKPDDDKSYKIKIDRTEFVVHRNRMTGAELRLVPDPPIPSDRDLFEIVPGRPDQKIEDEDRILIVDGLRFFTAPSTINPGKDRA